MCYTYDELSRVTVRTVKRISDDYVVSYDSFVYDAAGNIIGGDTDTAFEYDVNNRLTSFNGNAVSYDADGNMLSNGVSNFTYDSANRLVSADGSTYVYNAEDVRIRAVHNGVTTTYTYNTNAKLSQLLVKETNGVTTKYVYGLGLIGEEVNNSFKTYHFDYRGSTVAITNVNGTIADTFTYNTYGKLTARTGSTAIIFGYNGRDGVITEPNGLIYMRARYYSPDMRRFINADIIPGEISNAVTLNRYAYANGNPVMFVDPNGNIVIVESKNDRDVISTLMVLSDLTDYPLSYNWETKEVSYSVNNHSNNFPIGNELISTLIDSHHTVTINAIRDGFSGNGINRLSEDKVYYNETGGDARITFDLNSDPKVYTKVSSEKYSILQKRPAYIGLAHELIHALHYVQGTVQEENYKIDNYYYIRKRVLFFFHKTVIKTEHYKAEEFYTVGLSDFKDEKITENAIRKEHQIPKRTAYTVPY